MKYEKWNMIVGFIQIRENAEAANNLYHGRYPERRHPFRDILGRLRHSQMVVNLKRKAQHYMAYELLPLGKVE